MTASPPRHCWVAPSTAIPAGSDDAGPPQPYFDVRCHRGLRGPYTGGGSLLRYVVPELLDGHAKLLEHRATEVTAVAPELTSLIPRQVQTLTNQASSLERTRFYPATRTGQIAHGIAELLADWARVCHPAGVAIAFRELDEADPTDRELVRVLLRRCDPRHLIIIAWASADIDAPLSQALARHARKVAGKREVRPFLPPGADLAQIFIDSDGTSTDLAVQRAYASLTADERARRHTARAQILAQADEMTLRLGAIPYHLEHGADPGNAGARALIEAHNHCFDHGFYDSALEFALRGLRLVSAADQPKWHWGLTEKAASCLAYLKQGQKAIDFLSAARRDTTDPDAHMGSSYQMAMMYTRHLPKDAQDHEEALAWVNTAVALADRHPDPKQRMLFGAFMRNARALVELHRRRLDHALSLVNEAIQMTNDHLEPEEQVLHRSVLLFNRAQVLAALGDPEKALLDYDELIGRDPHYGDYYFERAAVRRAAGRTTDALADYATAIQLSLPFFEAHLNRADLLCELGDDQSALQDLNYAAELNPDHVDTLVNRADLLLTRGDTDRARTDIDQGLAMDPRNAHLLCARGMLLADTGDNQAAYTSYTAAIDEDPDFAAAWANRAVLSYAEGRAADAVSDLDHAIELTDDPSLRANRAIALQDLGEHRRALEDLDIAIAALGDEDPSLHYRRDASRLAVLATSDLPRQQEADPATTTAGPSARVFGSASPGTGQPENPREPDNLPEHDGLEHGELRQASSSSGAATRSGSLAMDR
ncbi:MAG TPA: tetratricopeptide repeat protein [Streptosporangiaceae bacterium]|nr:tetratricopeptide repeat protein [Streptosporangiaceae bacterium]